MITIDINRFTIQQLEKAIEKYNKLNKENLHNYVDIINKLLYNYLNGK